MGLNKRLIGAGATAGAGGLTPSENFKVVTYTGNGTSQAITNVGFKPDWVWIKNRTTSGYEHFLFDSTRGAGGNKSINSDSTNAEGTENTAAYGYLSSFDTDGFTLTAGTSSSVTINRSGDSYVAWCWKSGGGTTSSNSDGTITSTIQANQDSGFSIVKYTGTGGSTQTVGHGLSQKPDFLIVKNRDSATGWKVWHEGLTPGGAYVVELQDTTGEYSNASPFDSTEPGSSVFTVADFSYSDTNATGADYIAYAFHSVEGFSKFGSYTGTGATKSIETGFEPAFLLSKRISSTSDWYVIDNKRNTTNPRNNFINANTSDAEYNPTYGVNFNSNGFTLISTDLNGTGQEWIYMAFAADPDTEAPTLASSFNIETWTGNDNNNRAITGLGFSPNFVWIKRRSSSEDYALYDSIRGVNEQLSSNTTAAEVTNSSTYNGLPSFDSDGFSVGNNGGTNRAPETYVGWTWKADDNEPTIFGGGARAVYKFEDNGNDVTGELNLTASNMSYSSSGKFNKAAEFNGNNSSFTNSSITGLPTGTSPVSMSYWVYTDTSNQDAGLVGYGRWNTGGVNAGAANKYFGTMLSGGDLFFAGYYYNAAFSPAVTLPTGQWNHLVWTFDGTNVRAYLNGSLAGTVDRSSLDIGGGSGNLNITIGKNSWSSTGNEHFAGKIDQVRIYSGELKDIQVAELYAETASDNDDLNLGGPPEILVSANANAGFSIVKFEKQFSSSVAEIIPHGLSAVPNMIILKRTDGVEDWYVYHTSMGNAARMQLNSPSAITTGTNVWGQTNPTSTVFTVESFNAGEAIAYCFHDVTGYQKLGGYTGTGSAGQSITTGFKPDFVMIKSTYGTSNWTIYDTRRGILAGMLNPDNADAETTDSTADITITSTGFSITSGGVTQGLNSNTRAYIYWAVAKNVPSNTTLANSFKVVTYSSSGGSGSTEVSIGWSPDLVITKTRDEGAHWSWGDTLRGANSNLSSNDTNAVSTTNQWRVTDFHTSPTSISIAKHASLTTSNVTYAWKAGNTWQSNIDGTIGSTVNANTANGFSIIKYDGNNTAGATIGHGLTSAPEMVIVKQLDITEHWTTGHSYLNGGTNPWDYVVWLNRDVAEANESWPWNDTAPSSSVITLGSGGGINNNGGKFIAYAFHSVSGYSKIGGYTGNGSANNAITGLGFQPDWLMIKNTTDAGNDWQIYDSARTEGYVLLANSSNAEADNSSNFGQFDSDGFTVQSNNDGNNKSGSTYIYMAFKMN